MRSLVSFLLGLIISAAAILFLPDTRRENLSTELKGQIQVLQKQIRELGGQLKDIKTADTGSGLFASPHASLIQPLAFESRIFTERSLSNAEFQIQVSFPLHPSAFSA
jgi:hypothetical protein